MQLTESKLKSLQTLFPKFIDVAISGTGKATHYDSKKEQQAAIQTIHKSLLETDRSIYAMSCAVACIYDGLDYSRQLAVENLLQSNYAGGRLTIDDEFVILRYIANSLPAQRMLKTYASVVNRRINKSRMKRLVANTILNVDQRILELWTVKYRRKLRSILTHCWGERRTGILKSILNKGQGVDSKESSIILDLLGADRDQKFCECISFILGNENNISIPLLQNYVDAKENLGKGIGLPRTTLIGIRNTYHKSVSMDEVLKLVKGTLTTEEKRLVQKKAKAAGVEVEFDPTRYDPIKLYIYAYENGMTDEISAALKRKAKRAAIEFTMRYDNIGILLDASGSSFGHATQKLRPMAVMSSMVDMLVETCETYNIEVCGGYRKDGLIRPSGDTELAHGYLNLLENKPDAIYILSDGYENVYSGRLDEVIEHSKRIGYDMPIYQLNPVIGLESMGGRTLSQHVSVLPISSPTSMSLPLLKSVFEQDPKSGVLQLYGIVKANLLTDEEGGAA